MKIEWMPDVATATDVALSEGRPVMIAYWRSESLGCRKMDRVTFQDDDVAAMLNRLFVCVRVNLQQETAETKDALAIAKPCCTPTFVHVDARRIEVRRTIGWLPPDEFIPELLLALGAHDMVRMRFDDAYNRFRSAVNDYPESAVAPEALFLAAAAAFQRDGRKMQSLELRLRELMAKYPESVWAKKANVLDMKGGRDDVTKS